MSQLFLASHDRYRDLLVICPCLALRICLMLDACDLVLPLVLLRFAFPAVVVVALAVVPILDGFEHLVALGP